MIAASHVLFGAMACFTVFAVIRLIGIHSPPNTFHPLLFFMTLFPDLDHLYWMKVSLHHLIPYRIWDLFDWKLRTVHNSLTFFHYWIYPFVILALLAAPLETSKKNRWIILGLVLGWTVHLALDGVMYFV